MSERVPASPVDEYAVQLAGRQTASEIMIVLLLREKANAARLCAEGEKILTFLESTLIDDMSATAQARIVATFAAARIQMDKFAQEARRKRP